jgi:uncharacterized protein (UPF0335 family)
MSKKSFDRKPSDNKPTDQGADPHAFDTTEVAGGRIRSFVERIEQLETELSELNEQKKEVFSEAKGEGFDVKVLKEIIKLRKQDESERDEHDMLLDTYMRAMDAAPEAEAA